jgi:hypothetical protein
MLLDHDLHRPPYQVNDLLSPWPQFSNCGQVLSFHGCHLAGSDGLAGVTVLFEVDHAGCLILLSDAAGSKVHFGIIRPN